MPVQIPAASTEYVTVLAAARESGADVNLSTATVRFAFVAEGTAPVEADWTAGSWDTDSSATPTRYYARILVGPDNGVELEAGTYVVWVEITDDPETVVRPAGYLRVV